MKKVILSAIVVLAFTACFNKNNNVAYIPSYDVCKFPIDIAVNMILKEGNNNLEYSKSEVENSLHRAFKNTKCFIVNNEEPVYELDVKYTSSYSRSTQKDTLITNEKISILDTSVILTFQRGNKEYNFTAKGNLKTQEQTVLNLGASKDISPDDRLQNLESAVRSAVNKASKELLANLEEDLKIEPKTNAKAPKTNKEDTKEVLNIVEIN